MRVYNRIGGSESQGNKDNPKGSLAHGAMTSGAAWQAYVQDKLISAERMHDWLQNPAKLDADPESEWGFVNFINSALGPPGGAPYYAAAFTGHLQVQALKDIMARFCAVRGHRSKKPSYAFVPSVELSVPELHRK